MNKWEEEYKRKLTSAEAVAKTVRDGEKLFCGSGSSAPTGILDALFDRAGEVNDVVFGGLIMLAPTYKILSREMRRHIRFDNLYATPLDRQALHDGICEHMPFHFSDLPRLASEYADYRTVFTQVGPMDRHGYMSAGVSGNFLDVLHKLDRLVVEVNENQPTVHGRNFYHISQVEAVVEHHNPLLDLPPEPITEVDRAIAENIVEFIGDGDTIQLGIGAVPNAIGECLLDKRYLGCYTEMVPDAIMKLFEAGALDNTKKTWYPYQFNAFFAGGSNELYRWLDGNPMVFFSPISYNNDPNNVARNENMVSINSTLEMDLTGQCCSEAIGPYQYSATGGQVDFTRGAYMARGGRAFIATHSTAFDKKSGKTVSKIAPQLKPGATVTLTRTDVMYVATEYGVVNLKGKTLRERAQALISIAHPDFRSELIQYAKDVRYFILPEHEELG
ncbi:MAG: acetyl-CoA hydrolase/transferase C-terminal domain-containing protein [Actinomycetota bacterium]|nr:acetyl-CoA hydrolase/transferase C-terminal domain-containing protein [Actinomycetota bacterium]